MKDRFFVQLLQDGEEVLRRPGQLVNILHADWNCVLGLCWAGAGPDGKFKIPFGVTRVVHGQELQALVLATSWPGHSEVRRVLALVPHSDYGTAALYICTSESVPSALSNSWLQEALCSQMGRRRIYADKCLGEQSVAMVGAGGGRNFVPSGHVASKTLFPPPPPPHSPSAVIF